MGKEVLSAKDKQREIDNLLRDHARTAQRIKELGLDAPTKTKQSPYSEKAPDGGPVSYGHLRIKSKLVPTMFVKLLEIEGTPIAKIRRESFNPEKHKEVVKSRERLKVRDEDDEEEDDGENEGGPSNHKKIKGTVAFGSQTRDELLRMPMTSILKLPEVKALGSKAPDKKDKLVQAIMDQRAAAV